MPFTIRIRFVGLSGVLNLKVHSDFLIWCYNIIAVFQGGNITSVCNKIVFRFAAYNRSKFFYCRIPISCFSCIFANIKVIDLKTLGSCVRSVCSGKFNKPYLLSIGINISITRSDNRVCAIHSKTPPFTVCVLCRRNRSVVELPVNKKRIKTFGWIYWVWLSKL